MTRLTLSLTFLFTFSVVALAQTQIRPQAVDSVRPVERPDVASPTQLRPAEADALEARIRACLAREEALKTRMSALTRLANNMTARFTSVSNRVQEFYVNRMVPNGIVVENYTELVDDISQSHAGVLSQLEVAQSSIDGFSCEDGDIQSQYTEFRLNMLAVQEALREYRTSIQTLIRMLSVTLQQAQNGVGVEEGE